MKPIASPPGSAFVGADRAALVFLGSGIAAPLCASIRCMLVENGNDLGHPGLRDILALQAEWPLLVPAGLVQGLAAPVAHDGNSRICQVFIDEPGGARLLSGAVGAHKQFTTRGRRPPCWGSIGTAEGQS